MEANNLTLAKNIVLPVISGPDTQDTVIDLSLSMVAEEVSASKKLSQANISENKNEISTSDHWSRFRSEQAQGFVSSDQEGWISPINLRKILDDEFEKATSSEAPLGYSSEKTTDPLSDMQMRALHQALETFKGNSELFKEYLKTLRDEVQHLPLFQGAISSLNNSIIGQSDSIRSLAASIESGFSDSRAIHERLESVIASSAMTEGQQGSITIALDDIKNLVVRSSSQENTLHAIRDSLNDLDMQKLHGNLETIYQAVKKSIDENREVLKKISTLPLGVSDHNPALIGNAIAQHVEELKNQIEDISLGTLSLRKSIDSLNRKYTLGTVLTMLGMGVVVGGLLNMY